MIKKGFVAALALSASLSYANVLYESDEDYNHLNQVIVLQNNSLVKRECLSRFIYTYDNNGNISSLTKVYDHHPAIISGYDYDAQNRLISDAETKHSNQVSTDYAFDLQSNLRREGIASHPVIRTYNVRNELIAINGFKQTYFSYDAAGNLLSDVVGNMYAYNALNQLSQYTSATKQMTHYAYDGQGERLSKNNGAGLQNFYYDGITLMNSQDPEESALTSYLFGSQREAYLQGDNPQFYQFNLHDDVVELTDNQGNVTQNDDYDVYGALKSGFSSSNNPYRYAGYFYDPESGLYYLNARYYNPMTETFISEDTEVGGNAGYNCYLYVMGNPVMGFDKTGHGFHDIFPHEVQMMILQHLSPQQRVAVSRTCKLWRYLELASSPKKGFYKHILQHKNDQISKENFRAFLRDTYISPSLMKATIFDANYEVFNAWHSLKVYPDIDIIEARFFVTYHFAQPSMRYLPPETRGAYRTWKISEVNYLKEGDLGSFRLELTSTTITREIREAQKNVIILQESMLAKGLRWFGLSNLEIKN